RRPRGGLGHAPADRRGRPRRRPPARRPGAARRRGRARSVHLLVLHGKRGPTRTDVTLPSILLWVVLPYVCLAIFVVGHIWRYRYDKFGWTTRSSQLYESRLLRWGSPLFHFGILFVIGGHIIGLL